LIRDITLGKYYNADSPVHRLDPRTKLIITFAYLISLFIYKSPAVYICAFIFLLSATLVSKVPFKYILKGLKPVWFILIFTSLMNLFFTGGEPVFSWWRINISREGIERTGLMLSRFMLMIFGSNLMTLTTTPTRLTSALESLMKPLKVIHFPVHEIAMMMSIALRFIPILVDETNKIMKAQLSRGADFESGNIFRKVKSLVPVLVPLFISAFRRAGDLAMAMEARCYHGGEGRTQMNPLRYARRDGAAFAVFIFYIITIVFWGSLIPRITG